MGFVAPRKLPLCVDFDGVLHSNTSQKGVLDMPDPPVPLAIQWLDLVVTDGRFAVSIFSSRSRHPGGIEAMRAYLGKHGLRPGTLSEIQFPTHKPPYAIIIDDRCFCFEGTFPTKEWLLAFKSWNQK